MWSEGRKVALRRVEPLSRTASPWRGKSWERLIRAYGSQWRMVMVAKNFVVTIGGMCGIIDA